MYLVKDASVSTDLEKAWGKPPGFFISPPKLIYFKDKMFGISETKITEIARDISMPLARFSLFLVYFWFGALKIFSTSPANPLVDSLLQKTLPFLTFNQFVVGFAISEMVIGLLFLIPKAFKLAVSLFFIHMVTTFLPLILLVDQTWQSFLTPTLEGQYIIKNLVLIALVITLIAKNNLKREGAK